MTDIAVVALSQGCVSLYAWYFSGFCQAMSAPGPPGGRPRLHRERDDGVTRVSFVLRPDATESEARDLLLGAITEALQTELLDAYTRDALLQVHWGPADDPHNGIVRQVQDGSGEPGHSHDPQDQRFSMSPFIFPLILKSWSPGDHSTKMITALN